MHTSALCLAINEAILVRGKLAEAEIEVFANNLEDFRQEQDSTLKGLEKIEISDATVSNVEAVENQNLEVTISSNGSETSKVFEMIVLLTQPQLSNQVKQMSKELDLSLNYASFLAEGEGSVLLTTDHETVQLAVKT
jgi:hypothetical protein